MILRRANKIDEYGLVMTKMTKFIWVLSSNSVKLVPNSWDFDRLLAVFCPTVKPLKNMALIPFSEKLGTF